MHDNPERPTVLVLGNGMVGHRFCDELSTAGGGRYRLVVLGEEPRPAYDRVHLTRYLEGGGAEELSLGSPEWYRQRSIELHTSTRAIGLAPDERIVTTSSGQRFAYDVAVLATGSQPFVPPLPGVDLDGVFVYRTIEDLDAIRGYASKARRAVVLGGGLLGLEAAKAVLDLGLEVHVVEVSDRLMPRQLDGAASRLLEQRIAELGVKVHLGAKPLELLGEGSAVRALALEGGACLPADLVVISAGIRPRDELARAAGIEIGPRGGVMVNDALETSARNVYAIGECAVHRGTVYGLVAPGYAMAEVLARRLCGETPTFQGTDQSAKLKLLGVEVASFGEPFGDPATCRSVMLDDRVRGIYKKVLFDAAATRVLGGILVGDTNDYLRLTGLARSGTPVPGSPDELVLGRAEGARKGVCALAANDLVCSCNHVQKGALCGAVAQGAETVAQLKHATRAGTGCGGCLPLVAELLSAELATLGKGGKPRLCEHFDYTRQELYQIVSAKGYRDFYQLLSAYGQGDGCEICKPTVASILASVHNELITDHDTIQDTNDRYLANIQRGGLYSVVPRIPGGEITPEKLIALGEVAKKYGLYTKITGGQRIDLFGARLEELPDIWEELIAAGFESGHAYGKAMRTVKSCVGTTWCRYGVQDSVGFAVRVEQRYRGVRAPHKLKSAVSGCVRECAEAKSKDFGLIATEKGYNLYVGGNGGANPRHAELLAADLDEEMALRLIDRFLMFYIRNADRLTRTAKWLEEFEGGIENLRSILVEDRLGIAQDLESAMQRLVDSYRCEWTMVVNDPVQRAKFRAEAGVPRSAAAERDRSRTGSRGHGQEVASTTEVPEPEPISMISERGQRRPVAWPRDSSEVRNRQLPVLQGAWVRVGSVNDFPENSGRTITYGRAKIAVFNFASRGLWYATQARCPHKGDEVIARGLLGDASGVPKVACPQHKRCFSLESGECLGDEGYELMTFPVRADDAGVYLELPPVAEVEAVLLRPPGRTAAQAPRAVAAE